VPFGWGSSKMARRSQARHQLVARSAAHGRRDSRLILATMKQRVGLLDHERPGRHPRRQGPPRKGAGPSPKRAPVFSFAPPRTRSRTVRLARPGPAGSTSSTRLYRLVRRAITLLRGAAPPPLATTDRMTPKATTKPTIQPKRPASASGREAVVDHQNRERPF